MAEDQNSEGPDVNFLSQFSKLRVSHIPHLCVIDYDRGQVKQSKECPSADDIKHLLTGYCIFDANRVRFECLTEIELRAWIQNRYKLVKKKRVAIFGAVCRVEEDGIVLSSLTGRRLDIAMHPESVKMGDAVLLMGPTVTFNKGKMLFEVKDKSGIIHLGTAIDFGICSFEDAVRTRTMNGFHSWLCRKVYDARKLLTKQWDKCVNHTPR